MTKKQEKETPKKEDAKLKKRKEEVVVPRLIMITGTLDGNNGLHQTIQIDGYESSDIAGVMTDFTAAFGAVLTAHYSPTVALRAIRDTVVPHLVEQVSRRMVEELKKEQEKKEG